MPRTSKPRTPDENDIERKVAKQVSALVKGKASYSVADALMDELELEVEVGRVVIITRGKLAGKRYQLVDKFAERNKINVGLNARRYEFKELPPAP